MPLYNAVVYSQRPGEALHGGSHPGCAAEAPPPVTRWSIALTDATGAYTLPERARGHELPAGDADREVAAPGHHPRRPGVSTTTLGDVNQQRLPRNKSEGDIPQLAIATGSADPFQCLLLKMGLDTQEFSRPDAGGRIHMYVTPQGRSPPLQLSDGGSPPAASPLVRPGHPVSVRRGPAALRGQRVPQARRRHPETWSTTPRPAGASSSPTTATCGRRSIRRSTPSPTGCRTRRQEHQPAGSVPGAHRHDLPKGIAFQDWLSNVGALSGGKLTINDSRDDISPVNIDAGDRWVYGPNPDEPHNADRRPST